MLLSDDQYDGPFDIHLLDSLKFTIKITQTRKKLSNINAMS